MQSVASLLTSEVSKPTSEVGLIATLRSYGSAAVALSGGVDSAVVAKAAFLALGTNAVAVTADSPGVARVDFEDAKRIAAVIGIRHVIVKTSEFESPDYARNDGSRCYYCKSELYSQIETLLPSLGVNVICSGANLDDLGDYRPGLIAAAEHYVKHPLQEAAFSKTMVRELAKAWDLPVWDKPASPCLSSRIAPGVAATAERTRRVENAEAYLKSLGLSNVRVRCHEGELARIEVAIADIVKLADLRSDVTTHLQSLGFKFVTLDLAGFRSGSLNELIPLEIKQRLTLSR
ncbi:ATP-dependent sacrificial sulfur transferase LarE [soil metagenome]